jgi:hypothetical protein
MIGRAPQSWKEFSQQVVIILMLIIVALGIISLVGTFEGDAQG